jgi:hypothetical protein
MRSLSDKLSPSAAEIPTTVRQKCASLTVLPKQNAELAQRLKEQNARSKYAVASGDTAERPKTSATPAARAIVINQVQPVKARVTCGNLLLGKELQ